MAEQVYYDCNDVMISSTRAVFGSQTYVLGAITSVETRRLKPDHSLPNIAVVTGFAWCLIGAAVFMGSLLGGAIVLMIGLTLIVGGMVWGSRIKPTYAVILRTAGSETRVRVRPDETEINEIVHAISEAIIERG